MSMFPSAQWISRALLFLVGTVVAILCPAGNAFALPVVAVLDLDGYGVPYESAQIISQGLRDGFLDQGDYDPISGYTIAERLASGHAEEITRARALLASARQSMDAGNQEQAQAQLAEVLEIHHAAYSWVGRRAEMADACYYTAASLVASNRSAEALPQVMEALRLYPSYDTDRVVNPSAAMRSIFADAHRAMENQDRMSYDPTEISAIGKLLKARYIVVGYAESDGLIALRLYEDARLRSEISDRAAEVPLPPGDSFYTQIITRLIGALPIAPSSPSAVSATSPEFHELPALDEPLDEESETLDEPATSSHGSYDLDEPDRAKTGSGKIKARGGSFKYARKPITRRWWFWTLIGVGVVGGTYAIVDNNNDVPDDPKPHPRPPRYGVGADLSLVE